MESLRSIGQIAYETALKRGFRGNDAEPDNLEREIALAHSELSEALECLREDVPLSEIEDVHGKPVGFAIEMADVVIRVAETCHYWGVPLDTAIKTKMEYNNTRPFKHGGKKY